MATKQPQPVSPAEARARVKKFYDSISNRDYFQIFGADKDTDPERIKATYHMLARQWHTDAYAGVELGDQRETLEAIFKLITEAYDVITDPAKRAEYIVYLDRRAKGLSTDVAEVLRGEKLFDEGMARMNRRDWAGANEKFQEASKANPDDPLLQANHAWVIYNLGRKTPQAADAARRAADMLKAALKKQESLPVAHQFLGQISFDMEKFEEAKKSWRKCLEWDPNNIEAARGIRLATTRAEQKKSGGGIGGLINKLLKKK